MPAGMRFDRKTRPAFTVQIDLVGTAALPADGSAASRDLPTPCNYRPCRIPAARRRLHARSHHYEHQLTMAAGRYVFQLAVGAGPNAVAKLDRALLIDPWNSATFGLSAIAMSNAAHPVDAAPSSGGLVLEGRGPLVAAGRQIVPAAANRFARSNEVYFYVEIYDPALSSGNPSPGTMQYRILDRATGDVKRDSGIGTIVNFVRPGNPVVRFATRLAVADLPAGTYRLEVRAANAPQQNAAARSLDFELY